MLKLPPVDIVPWEWFYPWDVTMSQINPFVGVAMGGMAAQQQIRVEKDRQLRKAQTVQKDIAAEDDQLEHQVESSEELRPEEDGGGQGGRQPPRRDRKGKRADEPQRRGLDLTA